MSISGAAVPSRPLSDGMKVGAYSPFLHTRGGGERYFLEACRVLGRRHSVDILVPPGPRSVEELVGELQRTFALDLDGIRFRPLPSDLQPQVALREFDATISVTNDWPMIGAKRPHVAILQFPWGIAGWSTKRRIKAAWAIHRADRVLVYSQYTRRYVESLPLARCSVVAPAVALLTLDSTPKEPLILAVGRLTASGHDKKHGSMIEAFSIASKSLPGWRLALVGSLVDGDADYLDSLREQAVGLPVDFYPNAGRGELESLYRRASLFWHGAGLGQDPQRNPELMEHFGIVAVEAMSAGTVPLVFNGGGLPEIVIDGECGLLWTTTEELVRLSVGLATDDARRKTMAGRARERAKLYSLEAFTRDFEDALPEAMR
jgi:glycosyltransferase involved in cell wall biosynthesis